MNTPLVHERRAGVPDAQGTPTQNHVSPNILVYGENVWRYWAPVLSPAVGASG